MKKKKETRKIFKGLEDYGKLTEFEANELRKLKKEECEIKSFDHRVILHRGKQIDKKLRSPDWIAVHEVYYDKDHKIVAYVEEPATTVCEIWKNSEFKSALKDLKIGFKLIESAFEKEIINEEDLPKDEEENK